LVGFFTGKFPQSVLEDVGPQGTAVGLLAAIGVVILGEPIEGLLQAVIGGGVGAGGQECEGRQTRRPTLDRPCRGLFAAEEEDGIVDGGTDLGGPG
jgi:hypothetical protein